MAQFAISFSKQFTNTCQKLTVTDTSNYGFNNNTEHYDRDSFLVRQVTLRDIFNNTLQTKDITTGDSVEFDLSLLSIDQAFLNIALTLGGVGIGYELRVGGLLPCII